ncbi:MULTISPECIES: aldehyde dehydrogenase family protein [Thauera]|jgi:phenylacetaldehyde dehydrogenase|uniref:Aldehyde dehydrogenase family protein n=2 Tax=Thauera aminoaromatica TaxID=164330 RepID=C4ZJ24_THASP|nr:MULTISPECIES: aldehyde dehydrogenase family protein [Thauera]ACK53537.1 Betaine-aldehyde dehydrogenase [Thauera aminoaromatica]ENO85417.1 betaine-aldehyde dehydrogenase [Thauera aminoaromatica S2]MBP6132035.1 aldehyde dehydrogenase family protein [Thauera sp.]MBP7048780.1 aldehyde dehydrogenase family protein [Thauera sp.]MBX3681900.1 aldehyde dehydrogenase family protein [Thauera sp.]
MDRYKGELLSDDTRRFLAQPKRMAIGGEWVEALGGGMLEVVDPASGQVFDRVPAGEATDIDRAVAAARRAFEQGDWPRMRPVDRERLLLRLAELVEAHAQELAEIEALDNGKPVTMARAVDVALVVDFLRYMAGWATKIEGSTMEVSVPLVRDREFFGYTRREPVGVVGAIIPWNFPLLMVAWKAGPALASGCTMVLKPAEETPLSALRFAELVQQAGYPAGVFNVVTGHGHSAGAALAAHKGVDKVAFTGSTEIGKLVGKAALDNMTRVSLELGGKSPVIVLDDADPAVAAAGAAQAIFFNQGQVCCAGSRLYVHKSRFERVVEGLSGIAADMKLGAGIEPSTQIGPLVSAVQQQRVLGYIRSGFEEGARALAGGAAGEGEGYFVKPTVLVDTRDDMRVVREEIFGPVVVAMPYDDLDEVARRANDTPYGLGASIWSNDLSRVHRLVPKIKAGTVWVNCHNILDASMPFGGYKQSGIGREMGRAVLDLYTEGKSVIMAL